MKLNTFFWVSAASTVIYEYVISIELNTTDDTYIDLLREMSYPININDNVQVSDLNITTGKLNALQMGQCATCNPTYCTLHL